MPEPLPLEFDLDMAQYLTYWVVFRAVAVLSAPWRLASLCRRVHHMSTLSGSYRHFRHVIHSVEHHRPMPFLPRVPSVVLPPTTPHVLPRLAGGFPRRSDTPCTTKHPDRRPTQPACRAAAETMTGGRRGGRGRGGTVAWLTVMASPRCPGACAASHPPAASPRVAAGLVRWHARMPRGSWPCRLGTPTCWARGCHHSPV